jgi:hypothetical protein
MHNNHWPLLVHSNAKPPSSCCSSVKLYQRMKPFTSAYCFEEMPGQQLGQNLLHCWWMQRKSCLLSGAAFVYDKGVV